MKRVAVVIPTYKKELSELERISLAQAKKYLKATINDSHNGDYRYGLFRFIK